MSNQRKQAGSKGEYFFKPLLQAFRYSVIDKSTGYQRQQDESVKINVRCFEGLDDHHDAEYDKCSNGITHGIGKIMEFLLQIFTKLVVINYQLIALSLVIDDYLQFLPRFLLAGAVVGPVMGPLRVRFSQMRTAKIWLPRFFLETYAKMILVSIAEVSLEGRGYSLSQSRTRNTLRPSRKITLWQSVVH